MSEIDKFAIQAYELLHGPTPNLGDITKIATLPECDICTYSFPCQDISPAGYGKGIAKGTRSGLLFEVARLLWVSVRPPVLLMENVPGLINKNHKEAFLEWVAYLDSLGYQSTYKVLNAHDYGVPHARSRVFMISVLNAPAYQFPTPPFIHRQLSEFLDPRESVDLRYYVSKERLQVIVDCYKPRGFGVSATIAPDKLRIRPTNRYRHPEAPMFTLLCSHAQGVTYWDTNGELSMRRLTPAESWRLMGFSDEAFSLVQPHLSQTQLYKLAGNSIVIPVLESIYRGLYGVLCLK